MIEPPIDPEYIETYEAQCSICGERYTASVEDGEPDFGYDLNFCDAECLEEFIRENKDELIEEEVYELALEELEEFDR